MSLHVAWTLSLALLLRGDAVAQQVHVVDVGGGGDFSSVATATAAAADGDTIVVRPGSYAFSDAVIDGKSLVVTGDGTGVPEVRSLTVRNLGTSQSVVLADLSFGLGLGSVDGVPGLTLESCQGPVWVEDCTILGETTIFFFPFPALEDASPGLAVTDCDGVTVVRSQLLGGEGAPQFGSPGQSNEETAGGVGLLAESSSVALRDCQVVGGKGGSNLGSSSNADSEPGGDGIRAVASQLWLDGTTVQGGAGGDNCPSPDPYWCAGGDGLELEGACVVRLGDTTITAGPGGNLFGGGTGLPGHDQVVAPQAILVTWPGGTPSLLLGSPVVENAPTTLRYEGQQGDTFGLFAALSPDFLPLDGKRGVFSLAVPAFGPSLVWTVTAADGVFEVPFVAPDLAPVGIEVLGIHFQCFVATAAGPVVLSGPSGFIVLDDAL